jgi:hypothetical protein
MVSLAAMIGLPGRLRAAGTDDEIARLRQELQDTKAKLATALGRVQELEKQVATQQAAPGDPSEQADDFGSFGGEDGDTQPWSDSMRRSPMHVLFPGAATIPERSFYGRFLHVSRESVNNKIGSGEQTEPFHNLLGLEDNVRVGMLLGYGINDRWDAWVQRTNGRNFLKDWSGDSASFDYWDVMTKYRLLDEDEHGVDLAVYGGITYMMQDDESGSTSVNGGFTAEKSFFSDRLRLTAGLLYSSLSAYEATTVSDSSDDVAMTKKVPGEVSTPFLSEGDNHTLALPFGASLALSRGWQVFVEGITPIDGYDTGKGPTLALGTRYVTDTHEFALYFANSANNSFNSVLTGGYRYGRVDQFGFSISIFY